MHVDDKGIVSKQRKKQQPNALSVSPHCGNIPDWWGKITFEKISQNTTFALFRPSCFLVEYALVEQNQYFDPKL